MTRAIVVGLGVLLSAYGCNCSENSTCLPAPLSKTLAVEPGAMCPGGGTLVQIGGDYNCSTMFEESEVASTVLVCHPPASEAGASSLINVIPIAAGEECMEGGSAIETGVDDNRDGVLGEDEVEDRSLVCNGLPPTAEDTTCDGETSIYMGTVVAGDDAGLARLENITCVDGNVIINSNSITSLERASSLRKVTRDFLIVGNDALESLMGLRSLVLVGAALTIQNNSLLTDLQGLENLKKFGALKIVGNKLMTSLHGLEHLSLVGGDIEVAAMSGLTNLSGLDNITEIKKLTIQNLDGLVDISALGRLERARQQLAFIGNDALPRISLSVRRLDSSIDIFENEALQTVELPELLLSGDVRVRDNPLLNTVTLRSLATAGTIELTSNAALTNFSARSTIYLSGNLQSFANPALTTVQLDSLTTISGAFSFRDHDALTNFDGLRALETIGGAFGVRECAALTGFTGLGALTTINGSAAFRDNPALISFGELTSLREISGALDIIGNRELATSEAESFSQRVSVGDSVTIMNNGPG